MAHSIHRDKTLRKPGKAQKGTMTTFYQTLMQQQRAEKPFPAQTAELVAMRATRLAVYRKLLAAHDVHYQFSDDHSAYVAGKRERETLLAMQPDLDPDRAIWKQFIKGQA